MMELLVCFTFVFPLNFVLDMHLRFKLSALGIFGPFWNYFLFPGRKIYEKYRLGCQRKRNCFEAFTNRPWKTSTWRVETWLLRTHLLVWKRKLLFHMHEFFSCYLSLPENPCLIKKGCIQCIERNKFSGQHSGASWVLGFFMWL